MKAPPVHSPRAVRSVWQQAPGPLFWLFQGGFKVSSGTSEWYRSSFGTENSEIAGTVAPTLDMGVSPNQGP